MQEPIDIAVAGGVATITLNRPESRNSINQRVGRLLGETIHAAALDPGIRVVVVTGAGSNFCAGGDFKNFGAVDSGDALAVKYANDPLWMEIEQKTDRFREGALATRLLHTMGKPTIAMVRGPSVGAGVGLATCCDFRIASETATFHPGYIRVGISPDFGTSYYVTKLLGPAKAREFLMFGDTVDAAEALRIGLVNRVVADDRLEAETLALAHKLAKGPPIAMRYTKEVINAAETQLLDEVIALEARNFARCFQTQDNKEAVRAFMEKREPLFSGR